jgi:hypothetical protein
MLRESWGTAVDLGKRPYDWVGFDQGWEYLGANFLPVNAHVAPLRQPPSVVSMWSK